MIASRWRYEYTRVCTDTNIDTHVCVCARVRGHVCVWVCVCKSKICVWIREESKKKKYWEVVRNKKVAERKVRLKALEDEKTKAGPSKQWYNNLERGKVRILEFSRKKRKEKLKGKKNRKIMIIVKWDVCQRNKLINW